MIRTVALLALCAAGCSDVFTLPLGAHDDGSPGGDDLAGGGGGSGGGAGSGGGGGGGSTSTDMAINPNLPAACARLSCVPATMEGDVTLSGGTPTMSGCHAYDRLTIMQTVKATQYFVCANNIVIGGALDANGGGDDTAKGMGAGGSCLANTGAAGGGHGGAGADPGACGGGEAFGDPDHPREPGSGGGGVGGGKGGGVIELVAGSINLLSLIRANGLDGSGTSAGGGAGGSVLIDVDQSFGAGRVEARGGTGVGLRGGGGGGGRVAVHVVSNAAGFDLNVDGGGTSGGAAGAAGTAKK